MTTAPSKGPVCREWSFLVEHFVTSLSDNPDAALPSPGTNNSQFLVTVTEDLSRPGSNASFQGGSKHFKQNVQYNSHYSKSRLNTCLSACSYCVIICQVLCYRLAVEQEESWHFDWHVLGSFGRSNKLVHEQRDAIFPPSLTIYSRPLRHRIIECFGLEGTFRGHLKMGRAQPSCSEQGHLQLDQVSQRPVQPHISQ